MIKSEEEKDREKGRDEHPKRIYNKIIKKDVIRWSHSHARGVGI